MILFWLWSGVRRLTGRRSWFKSSGESRRSKINIRVAVGECMWVIEFFHCLPTAYGVVNEQLFYGLLHGFG